MQDICIGDYEKMGYHQLEFQPDSVFLVTGGAGFIGTNLCEAILGMGYSVVCLDNFSTGKMENLKNCAGHPKFTLIDGDIRELETCISACEGVDYVLNQAAWGSIPRSIATPLLYEQINIQGTLNMLEAARQNHVKRFVYASSSSVYGDSTIMPKREGTEGKILSPYALTKRVNEEYAGLYTQLYGVETIGLRYFNVFGRYQNPEGNYAAVIPIFVRMLLNDERPTINGDGRQFRDFTYIENVVEANLKACLADEKAVGQAFNIAYGGQEYIIDLYNKLCELLQKEIKPIFGPERAGDVKCSNADISKARELLDYHPEYDFAKGIELTVEWYKEFLTGV